MAEPNTKPSISQDIVYKSASDISLSDGNPRLHSPQQITQLMASIVEFGFALPILIDDESVIIAGHGRFEASQELGIKEIPCLVAVGWSDEMIKAYRIADNRLAENSVWSIALLKEAVVGLQESDFNVGLTGLSDADVSNLLDDIHRPPSSSEGGSEGNSEGGDGEMPDIPPVFIEIDCPHCHKANKIEI